MKKLQGLLCLLTAMVIASASALADYATLQNGDTGQAVVNLQVALNQLGYNTGGTDGKYGTSTENAVRKFQGKYGLVIDGKAGNTTQTLIYEKVAALSSSESASTTTTTSSSSSSTLYFGGDYSTLSYGAYGSRVYLLQAALISLGYDPGSTDKNFGVSTQNAVIAFQKSQGLSVDGKAGKATLKRIEKLLSSNSSSSAGSAATATPSSSTTTASGYTVPSRTLRRGYSGSDVKSVQTRLKELGYYTGSIDGVYGTSTILAIKAFQKANDLTADGLAGTKTFVKLFSSTASKASAAATAAASATPTPTPVPSSLTDGYETLCYGSKGTEVTKMQQALLNLNYTVTVNGTYDSATKAAVKAFQKNNGLTQDGVAGTKTLAKLYSGKATAATSDTTASTSTSSDTSSSDSSSSVSSKTASTAVGTVRLLHWFKDIKPNLSNGQTLVIYEPSSGLSWSLKVISRGNHADCEPWTAEDTANMLKAFGGVNTWSQKAVYIKLPNGTWTLGSTHDKPHLTGSIKDNNFDGHLCVHFFRDMSECKKNDPNYGVSNQETIRAWWKALTGETIN